MTTIEVGRPNQIDVDHLTEDEIDVNNTVRQAVPGIGKSALVSGSRQIVAGIKYVFNYQLEKGIKPIEIIDQYWLSLRTINYFNDKLQQNVTLQFVITPFNKSSVKSDNVGVPKPIDPKKLTREQYDADKAVRRVDSAVEDAELIAGTEQLVAGVKYEFIYRTKTSHQIVTVVDVIWRNERTIKYHDSHGELQVVVIPILLGPLSGTDIIVIPIPINVDHLNPEEKSIDSSIRWHIGFLSQAKLVRGQKELWPNKHYYWLVYETSNGKQHDVYVTDNLLIPNVVRQVHYRDLQGNFRSYQEIIPRLIN